MRFYRDKISFFADPDNIPFQHEPASSPAQAHAAPGQQRRSAGRAACGPQKEAGGKPPPPRPQGRQRREQGLAAQQGRSGQEGAGVHRESPPCPLPLQKLLRLAFQQLPHLAHGRRQPGQAAAIAGEQLRQQGGQAQAHGIAQGHSLEVAGVRAVFQPALGQPGLQLGPPAGQQRPQVASPALRNTGQARRARALEKTHDQGFGLVVSRVPEGHVGAAQCPRNLQQEAVSVLASHLLQAPAAGLGGQRPRRQGTRAQGQV
ncbi:MAG: hypothetical protein A2064_08010 [Spirochaetes bacterium GWB1_66_5]|nr:MAG: hypothetical protein A2064_08010 [Spirochaetes bacterium GWB1_66_5]